MFCFGVVFKLFFKFKPVKVRKQVTHLGRKVCLSPTNKNGMFLITQLLLLRESECLPAVNDVRKLSLKVCVNGLGDYDLIATGICIFNNKLLVINFINV